MPENPEQPVPPIEPPDDYDGYDKAIDDTQRNGSITGMGVVRGFSLTFLGQWTLGSGNWVFSQFLALMLGTAGVLLELVACSGYPLYLLLVPLASQAVKSF